MVCIYLGLKNKSYKSHVRGIVYAEVTVSKKIYEKCNTFEVVTYNIKYDGNYDNKYITPFWNFYSYYNLYIYSGSDNKSKNVFSYYWPKKNDDIIKQVEAYYSVLDPSTPISIIFTTRASSNNKYYCSYKVLVKNSYNYYYLKGNMVTDDKLTGYIVIGRPLSERLQKDWNELSKSKKLTFIAGSGDKKNISDIEYDINTNDKKFKKRIYTPNFSKSDLSELYSDNFIEKSVSITEKNLYLSGISNQQFDGVISYYITVNSKVLLIEFVKDSNKTHIERVDNDGKCWKNDQIKYDDDEGLERKLNEISSGLKSNKECEEQENSSVKNGESSSGLDNTKQENENGTKLSDSGNTINSSSETIGHGIEDTGTRNGVSEDQRNEEKYSNSGHTNWAAIGGGSVGAVGLGGTGFALYKFNGAISSFIRGIV